MHERAVTAGRRPEYVHLFLRRRPAALGDPGAAEVERIAGARLIVEIQVEIVVAVRQGVEQREPEIQLLGRHVDEVRGHAVARAERKRLGRVVVDEAVDDERQAQPVNAGRVAARVAEFDGEADGAAAADARDFGGCGQ